MPLYDFQCPDCEAKIALEFTIKEYSEEFTSTSCPKCEDGVIGKNDRTPTAANITRASYVDGTRRPGFDRGKEIVKLKAASYDLPHDKRGDINKEINTIAKGK